MSALPQPSVADKAAVEAESFEARAERRWNAQLLWLLVALTFGTGIIDAIGYLALDHVFVGNMTGNVAILGMAFAGADGLPVVGPLAALLCFSAGAASTGLMLRRKPAGWSLSIMVLLLFAGLILAAMGTLAFALHDNLGSETQVLVSSLSAVAMGIQACVARKLAVREMTTVVVTSTLTALAGELFFGSGIKALLNRRTAAIAALLLGASVGALLLTLGTGPALLTSAAIMIAAALLGQWAANRRTAQA